MLGHNFQNDTLHRMTVAFGTIFNDIEITREDSSNNAVQSMRVPLAYGPAQKFLAMIKQDPNKQAPSITLPRMSFTITTIAYDSERKINNLVIDKSALVSNNATFDYRFAPAPYNIEFELSILSKYALDGSKIIEQILPFFQPDWTPTVKLLDNPDYYVDLPIILNGVSVEDLYEGNFEERRAITWTLNFTMKGYFFGPRYNKKIIKFANTNLHTSLSANSASERVTVSPGLTANGLPTTTSSNSVPYTAINFGDDWGYIVEITDVPPK